MSKFRYKEVKKQLQVSQREEGKGEGDKNPGRRGSGVELWSSQVIWKKNERRKNMSHPLYWQKMAH